MKNDFGNKKKKEISVQALILLLAGVMSILLVIQSIPAASFSAAIVFPSTVLVCGSLLALYRIHSRWMTMEAAGIHIAVAAAVTLRRDLLAEQFAVLCESVLGGTVQGETDLTVLALSAGVMFSVWFFLFEVVWGILACLSGLSVMLVFLWGQEISNAVFRAEGAAVRNLQRISGEAQQSAASGRVSGWNNYRTGEIQMEVTLLESPENTIYLKGFSGGDYTGGEWLAANDQEIFHEMASVLGWEQWESWIGEMYYNLYYSMNAASSENRDHARTIFLNYDAGTQDVSYVPYYSVWINRREQGYGFRYFEESDMGINWDNVSGNLTLRDWYRQVQETYQQVMQDVYTQVPENLIPRLTELCGSRTPVNRDVVEYALFDNHKGYCVHFASAATLMYRLFDIPARYVSGYVVLPSDFTQQEDGTWKAEITDESAHAWTEIFIENYGWTPVEVTPAADGSFSTSYPGMEAESLQNIVSSIRLNIGGTEENDVSVSVEAETDAAETEDTGDLFDPDRYHDQILVLVTAAAEFIVFLPFLFHYRRLRRQSRMRKMECREVFDRLLEMLRLEGYIVGYSGTEPEFAKILSEKILCIHKRDVERMQEIVQRAAYGRRKTEEEENEFVRKIYIKVSDSIEGQLKGAAKLRFKWKF